MFGKKSGWPFGRRKPEAPATEPEAAEDASTIKKGIFIKQEINLQVGFHVSVPVEVREAFSQELQALADKFSEDVEALGDRFMADEPASAPAAEPPAGERTPETAPTLHDDGVHADA